MKAGKSLNVEIKAVLGSTYLFANVGTERRTLFPKNLFKPQE